MRDRHAAFTSKTDAQSKARLRFFNARLCCAAALPPFAAFLFQSETARLMLVRSD